MNSRALHGDWAQTSAVVRQYWPHLSEHDVASLSGERDQLMRMLKDRYKKSYGQIEREVSEFELRELRTAYAARPSLGILNEQ